MRVNFRTIKFLAATTAMTSGILPTMLLSAGLVVGSTGNTLADDPSMIPLEYLNNSDGVADRLGIWAAINNGKAQRYIFDTGSDQLNTQIGSEVTGVQTVAGYVPYVYTYGDESYGYKLQTVEFDDLTFSDPENKSKITVVPALGNQKYKVGKILDFIYTKNYTDFKDLDPEYADVKDKLKDIYGKIIKEDYYADRKQRNLMNRGKMAEEGGKFAGTFGAGDFLFKSSAWGIMGGATKSGFIVSANANTEKEKDETPGCSPCTIINLNPSLRAQYTNIMPWQEPGTEDQNGDDFRPNFPGSGAHASTLYEGNYDLQYTAAKGQKPIAGKAAALLDTGTPEGGSLTVSDALFKEFQDAGVELNKEDVEKDENGEIISASGSIPNLTIAGPDGHPVTLENIDFTYTKGTAETPNDETTIVAGLDFFKHVSVVFDLENQSTAYTPYFVSANNFTTDAPGADELQLSRITTQMGNEGWLGIAGVVSGTGSLTLDPKTDARMTNANTYTGATYISRDASLALAGPGSIENSVRVVNNGTLDIQEKGHYQKKWGVSSAYNDARIRSLSGTGDVLLLERTLVLTDAKDTFAGSISDIGGDDKHAGGGLSVTGGVQTLSGQNVFTGTTTVGAGARLLLSQKGSLASPVTVSGLFANDGKVAAETTVKRGGTVAGAGTFGGLTVATGGASAPGSVLDPAKTVSALTVTGNFVQQAGSTYQAGLASASDLIDVAGTAAIDSEAHIELLRQGTPSVDTPYTLLTAAGGVNGTYGGLTGAWVADTPFVDFSLAYDPQNVFLNTKRTATAFAEVGTTFNQRSLAEASQALGAGNPIYDNILFLTTSEARNAFDQLSGEIHASVHSTLIQDSHFVRDAASERVRAAFDGVGASSLPVMAYGPGEAEMAPATSENFAVWGRGFGAWGHMDADGNTARIDRSTGGFIAGGDALVGEHWRLGLLAGYSHTSFDVDDRASSGSSNNYHLGLYVGTQRGPVGFRSGLAYTWHRVETDRIVGFPGFSDSLAADYDAGTFQAFGELGYRLDTASVSFEPYANLAYVKFKADGFSEDGGAAALSSGDQSSDTTFTTLGLRASSEFMLGSMMTTVRGGIGWQHAFDDVTPETSLAFASGSSFAVKGTSIAENAAVIEAGLDVSLSKSATLGLTYQGQLASDAQEHGFNAKLGVRF